MRISWLFLFPALLTVLGGCATAALRAQYEAAPVAGACSLAVVAHSEHGKGPVQVTRDEGESDHQHFLVGTFMVTYAQTLYDRSTSHTVLETVALAPDQEFAAFEKPRAVAAAVAGACTRHNRLSAGPTGAVP
jgi:hypothetical protein